MPEAWGRDAFVTLGALARVTERIGLGTGIVNIYSRTPALLAMAALTLDEISGGRAVLGLGTSGQRVVEGWHGVPMARPLRRLRETTEAVRGIVSGSRRGYTGETLHIAPGFAVARPSAPSDPIPSHCRRFKWPDGRRTSSQNRNIVISILLVAGRPGS